MNVFVYVRGKLSCGRDEIEDAITEALGDAGEVTGGGAGTMGSNVDIEITDRSISADAAVETIRTALARFDLPRTSTVVADGTKYPLYP